MRLGPIAVHVLDFDRVNQCDHWKRLFLFHFLVGVDPEAGVVGFACQPCFFPSFGCGCLCWRLFVHRPSLGDDPAFGASAGDDAYLDLVFAHPVAQCCELRAYVGFASTPQFERQLFGFDRFWHGAWRVAG